MNPGDIGVAPGTVKALAAKIQNGNQDKGNLANKETKPRAGEKVKAMAAQIESGIQNQNASKTYSGKKRPAPQTNKENQPSVKKQKSTSAPTIKQVLADAATVLNTPDDNTVTLKTGPKSGDQADFSSQSTNGKSPETSQEQTLKKAANKALERLGIKIKP
ncbi:MAG: hypothetical protein AAGI66_05185 [Cyanobacteria bacterium P01_H01_bin.74]